MTKNNDQPQLKRSLGFFTALSTVMGTVIGAGVFFKTASVAQVTGNPSLHLAVWLISGLITLCGGLTVAELAAAIPETGGMMAYIERTYGKFFGFLLGWVQIIIYIPAMIAALSIIFANQLVLLLQVDAAFALPIATLAGASIVLINLLGAKASGVFQIVSLISKLIPLIAIIGIGLIKAPAPTSFMTESLVQGASPNFLQALGGGLLATMFAYDGWIHVGSIAGELKNPSKELPKTISLGLALVIVIYLLVNYVFLAIQPANEIAGNMNLAAQVANSLLGSIGGKLITIGIIISVYGAMNGYVMSGMRLTFVMARHNMLPFSKYLGRISLHTAIPYIAAIFELSLTVLMIFSGSFETLTNMLIFVIWMFYSLVFLAVPILRHKEPDLTRPYRVPFYPFLPIIALLGGIFILIYTLIQEPGLALIGISMTLLGVPVYYYRKKKNLLTPLPTDSQVLE